MADSCAFFFARGARSALGQKCVLQSITADTRYFVTVVRLRVRAQFRVFLQEDFDLTLADLVSCEEKTTF